MCKGTQVQVIYKRDTVKVIVRMSDRPSTRPIKLPNTGDMRVDVT